MEIKLENNIDLPWSNMENRANIFDISGNSDRLAVPSPRCALSDSEVTGCGDFKNQNIS